MTTVASALPGFDVRHLDDLEDLAHALLFTQVTLVARANRVRQLPALAAEGYPLRATPGAEPTAPAIDRPFEA